MVKGLENKAIVIVIIKNTRLFSATLLTVVF
jgi:hypothetical protein